MSWKNYHFTECSVKAIQLSRDTQYEIMDALSLIQQMEETPIVKELKNDIEFIENHINFLIV